MSPFGTQSIKAIAIALGGQTRNGAEVLCPGPGHSARDRSLSVRFAANAPEGFVTHSFAGDEPLACRDYVRARLGIVKERLVGGRRSEQSGRNAVIGAAGDRQHVKIAAALRTWSEAVEPQGTLVEQYLASRRLKLDAQLADAIRFHPKLPLDSTRLPAMVALLRDIRTDEPCGIVRTWMDANGAKLTRRMLGRASAAAVKLDEDAAVTHALTLGEGTETGLAARQLGCGPVWAAGSAHAIQAFPLLAGIEALTILAENDASGANARAIAAVAERWICADREVFVLVPPRGDMNDPLIGESLNA